eukprot:967266-Alexandrium_andersonii.AAC.1
MQPRLLALGGCRPPDPSAPHQEGSRPSDPPRMAPAARAPEAPVGVVPVSYTHLTLPTICSV